MDAPKTLRYTKTHEWVKFDGKIATVGITDFAQDQLSDLTYVELPTPGDSFSAQEEVAVVESITDVNKALIEKPELINTDPYGEGWIFKLQLDDQSELESLLDVDSYEQLMPDEE